MDPRPVSCSHVIRCRIAVGIGVMSALVASSDLSAQSTVSGRVQTEQGLPVARARIDLVGATQSAETDSMGRFRLPSLNPGRHVLRARSLGFLPSEVSIVLGTRDTTVVIALIRAPNRLSEVTVRGNWQGIHGIVGDAISQAPLSGVAVRIVGVSSDTRTDDSGIFSAPTRAGSFVVRLEKEGYAPKTLSIEVPRDSSREVLVSLDTSSVNDARTQILWREYDSRTRMRGMNSALVPAGELARIGTQTLSEALRRAPSFATRNLRLADADICLYVNGEPKPGWTMDAFDVDEILSIEVYGRGGELTRNLGVRWPKGEPCGRGHGASPVRLSERERRLMVQSVVIWLKDK